MKIKVGDYVAWDFKQHCFDSGASIGFITPKTIFKGYVEKIKTHDFFFFKRDYPLYRVNGVWVRRIKPIQKEYASLRKVYGEGTPLESVWELYIS